MKKNNNRILPPIKSSENISESNASTYIFFIIALIFLYFLYFPAFNGPLYLDSKLHLNDSPLETLTKIFQNRDQTLSSIGTRLFVTLTFGANEWLLGHSPKSFRSINVLIHWFSMISCYFFLKNLLYALNPKNNNQTSALSLSFIWGFHPIATTSVSYIIQRSTAMSAIFLFLAFATYLRSKQDAKIMDALSIKWYAYKILLITVLFLFAIASKETAILGIPMLLIIEISLSQSIKKVLKNRLILFFIIAGTLFPIFFIYHGHRHEIKMLLDNYNSLSTYSTYNWLERLLTESRVIVIYFIKLFIPLGDQYHLHHTMDISKGLFSPITTFYCIVFHIALTIFAIINKSKNPLLFLSILCFYISQIMESTIIPLHIYFEHRVYFPSIFIFLALFSIISYPTETNQPKVKRKILLFTLLIFLSANTYWRNTFYGSPLKFYENDLKTSNTNLAHCNFGDEQLKKISTKGQEIENNKDIYNKAMFHFNKAISLNKNHFGGYAGRGACKFGLGDYKGAVEDLVRARELNCPQSHISFNAGIARLALGQYNKAMQDFQIYSESTPPNLLNAYTWAAISALINGHRENSSKVLKTTLSYLNKCITLAPDTIDYKILKFITKSYSIQNGEFAALLELQKSIKLMKRQSDKITNFILNIRIIKTESQGKPSYHFKIPNPLVYLHPKKLYHSKLNTNEKCRLASLMTEICLIAKKSSIEPNKYFKYRKAIYSISIKNELVLSPYYHMAKRHINR